MPKVVTLTPNPALDIATHVDRLVPSHKMRCGPARRDPGGGGINVARAVHRLGGQALAVYAAGGGSGDELADLLDREGLPHRPVRVAGHTRESFHVVEDRSGEQYRFILAGEPLSPGEANACIAACLAALSPGDYLVCSGSLPPGVAPDFYARAIHAAKIKGAVTVIDSQGDALRAALAGGVDIVKASAREWSEYLGTAPQGPRAWREAIAGRAPFAIVTLGAQGAVLVSGAAAWHATVPKVSSSTTVGAGDSFLGGFLVKRLAGAPDDVALRYAAAAGTAAMLVAGTALCERAEVERLNAEVTIAKL